MKRIFFTIVLLNALTAQSQICACKRILYKVDTTYCIGTPFPVISLSSVFSPACSGPITYSWTPSTPPTTPGTYTYSLTATKGTASCTHTVKLHAFTPSPLNYNFQITSSTINMTQCCGTKKFKISDPNSSNNPTFPPGTTFTWYIKKAIMGGLWPIGTEGPYPTGNPCLADDFSFTPQSGIWYKFGTSVSPFAPGGSLVLSLPANLSDSYFVTCYISFPSGSYNCMPSGYLPVYSFTVAPPTVTWDAPVVVQPNCDNNGSITINNVQGGIAPYTFRLVGGSSSAYTSSNIFTGLNPTTNYSVIIRSGMTPYYCYTPVPVGVLGWNGPGNVAITGPSTIPCNGSITLTATNYTGHQYQWMVCDCNTCTGACTTCASYTNIGSPTSSNTLTTSSRGCYKVKLIDPDGGCKTSAAKKVKSVNPFMPFITGTDLICNTNGHGILTTNATGSLLWSTAATTQSINITSPGTYTVSRTLSGCTSTSPPFVVNGDPCNCTSCEFSISAVSALCLGTVNGVSTYNVTFTINNNSDCISNINILQGAGTTGTITPSSSTIWTVPPGSTTRTITFVDTYPLQSVFHFNVRFWNNACEQPPRLITVPLSGVFCPEIR